MDSGYGQWYWIIQFNRYLTKNYFIKNGRLRIGWSRYFESRDLITR